MFDLPQIAYGNMALIFPSHFHGYNKNEIFADYWGYIYWVSTTKPGHWHITHIKIIYELL
jgi:hypothetical protein